MSPHESAQPADEDGPHEGPAAGEQADNNRVDEQVGGVNAFSLSCEFIEETTEAEVAVRLPDGSSFTRKFNVLHIAARTEFAHDVAKKFPGITCTAIVLQLVPYAAEAGERLLIER